MARMGKDFTNPRMEFATRECHGQDGHEEEKGWKPSCPVGQAGGINTCRGELGLLQESQGRPSSAVATVSYKD